MSWEITADDSMSGGSGEIPPEGTHAGILIALVDLGVHEDTYQGRTYETRKVFFAWELTAEHKQDGQTFVVGQDFSMSEKVGQKSKLRQMLQGWRGSALANGEKLSIDKLLMKPCLVNIIHATTQKGRKVAKINSISAVLKGYVVPRPTRDAFLWHFGDGPAEFPDWLPFLFGRPLAEHVKEAKTDFSSPGPNGQGAEPPLVGAMADIEIPF